VGKQNCGVCSKPTEIYAVRQQDQAIATHVLIAGAGDDLAIAERLDARSVSAADYRYVAAPALTRAAASQASSSTVVPLDIVRGY
jgi:predicted nicotinamide N-methyase